MTRTRSLAVLIVAALLAAACGGLDPDDTPVGLSEEAIPAELTDDPPTTTSTLPPDVTTTPGDLYLVMSTDGDDILMPCAVPTPAGLSPEERARAVLERLSEAETGDGEECPDSLSNAVPSSLELFSLRLIAEEVNGTPGNTLELNFSKLPLSDIEASQQRRAIAQIVFTATGVAGVSAVRFYADGEPTGVPVDDRTAEPGTTLTREDFPRMLDDLEGLQDLVRAAESEQDNNGDDDSAPVP